jgi:hypothetical protein
MKTNTVCIFSELATKENLPTSFPFGRDSQAGKIVEKLYSG